MRLVNGYAIVWRFTIRADAQHQFETTYGPNGAWAVLFARGAGYRGTELLRSTTEPHTYFTIDRWDTESDFDEFHRKFAAEYTALDLQCEGLTESETKIGTFVKA